MTITKEQWVKIQQELEGLFPSVEFKLGDDTISIARRAVAEGQFKLCVYINGTIEGGWFSENNDRPACVPNVWKQRSKAKYSAKDIKEIEKWYGKRRAKKEYPELHAKHIYHEPFFSKASVLVAQFKKIDGLELIKKDQS